MARYSRKRIHEATLSDGSILRFRAPMQKDMTDAGAATVRLQADLAAGITDGMTDAQLAAYRAEQKREADAKIDLQARAAAAAGPARKAAKPAPAPPKPWSERMWDTFEFFHLPVFVGACMESWKTTDGEDVVGDPADLEIVPGDLIREAARAIFTVRVNQPEIVRGN